MKYISIFFIVLLGNVLQADQYKEIREVQELFKVVPDHTVFINRITDDSKNKKSIIAVAEEENPRLFAALQQFTTSLAYSDQEFEEKLHELELEQKLLTALNVKDLSTVLNVIDNGADSNSTTEGGHTPLILAVLQSDQLAVQKLLKHGARITPKAEFTFKDKNGIDRHERMDALELAQELNYQPLVEILKKAS